LSFHLSILYIASKFSLLLATGQSLPASLSLLLDSSSHIPPSSRSGILSSLVVISSRSLQLTSALSPPLCPQLATDYTLNGVKFSSQQSAQCSLSSLLYFTALFLFIYLSSWNYWYTYEFLLSEAYKQTRFTVPNPYLNNSPVNNSVKIVISNALEYKNCNSLLRILEACFGWHWSLIFVLFIDFFPNWVCG